MIYQYFIKVLVIEVKGWPYIRSDTCSIFCLVVESTTLFLSALVLLSFKTTLCKYFRINSETSIFNSGNTLIFFLEILWYLTLKNKFKIYLWNILSIYLWKYLSTVFGISLKVNVNFEKIFERKICWLFWDLRKIEYGI